MCLFLSLSLSLSHTHTNTHTHTDRHTRSRSLTLLSRSLSLSLSRARSLSLSPNHRRSTAPRQRHGSTGPPIGCGGGTPTAARLAGGAVGPSDCTRGVGPGWSPGGVREEGGGRAFQSEPRRSACICVCMFARTCTYVRMRDVPSTRSEALRRRRPGRRYR